MDQDKNNITVPSPMDYDRLRDYGLEYIRKIGSRFWTDFSAHDPGVTILEALTLSIADLSYRSSAGMADLLTRRGKDSVSMEGTMFPGEQILPNAPTTVDDYRKIMLENIPGIRNIWFDRTELPIEIPFIAKKILAGSTMVFGCYNVRVELESLDSIFGNERILAVVGRDDEGNCADHIGQDNYRELYSHCIRSLYLKHRNLCEDILDITFMEQVRVGICAELEIGTNIDLRLLLQQIYDRLYDYVNPTIEFHTVEELLSMGREAGDIFSVRSPGLGFIDRTELSSFRRKTDLYASDVIAILMHVEGIRSVRHIHFTVEDTPSRSLVQGWRDGRHIRISALDDVSFTMAPDFQRYRKLDKDLFVNNVVFLVNGLSFLPPEGQDGIRVQTRKDERVPLAEGFSTALPIPQGRYRSTDRYFSFQNLFPATYRMGIDTLPESASGLRKAERMQLKAYLAFFDQTLSDCLSQLDRFQDLLSVQSGDGLATNDTYFHGHLTDDDVVDVSEILNGYPDYPVPEEDADDNLRRKNEVLDHLLSRFADSFAEYTALEFIRNRTDEGGTMAETVDDKKRFLGDYPRISSLRSCGIDMTEDAMVSGAERRIMRRLGVNDPDRRAHLSEGNEMGLYIVEHLLLVPKRREDGFLQLAEQDGKPKLIGDPYSFRVTVVMPGWTAMSCNLNYRKFAERITREEIPAHIFVKVCWISREVMACFEKAYSTWHDIMKRGTCLSTDADWEQLRSVANAELVDAIGRFANVYPEAVLMSDGVHDYDDGNDITRLDSTFIGSEDAGDSEEVPPTASGDSSIGPGKTAPEGETASTVDAGSAEESTSSVEESPSVSEKAESGKKDDSDAVTAGNASSKTGSDEAKASSAAERKDKPSSAAGKSTSSAETTYSVGNGDAVTAEVKESCDTSAKVAAPRILVLTSKTSVENSCRKAGAAYAGKESYITKIKGGWTSFDVIVCETQFQTRLSKVESILKPLGLMPSFENGTITDNVLKTVKAILSGEIAIPANSAGSKAADNATAEDLSRIVDSLKDSSSAAVGNMVDGLKKSKSDKK